ncbi:MAG TPA: hypothetical protein VGG48_05505 [Rhizomicrobium sp.]|jgi:tetratricopeptide (TPR) repeat protein
MAEESGGSHAPRPAESSAALLAAALGALSGSGKVEQLIERQIELADLQIEDIKRDDTLRRWSLRFSNASAVMKVSFELAVALLFLAVASVVLGAMWSAHEARGLVIEPFQVPQSLAERGLSGQVVASRLLDKLADLQDSTDSLRAPNSYANNWGNDIKVQIPDTGVSIGEFNRYLRQWLGNETHITGEIWRTDTGIAVVARAGADAGVVFTGRESDLDALIEKAAAAVFEKTQPYRYAVHLANTGGDPAPIVARLAATGEPREQAWAYSLWSNTDYQNGDWRAALAKNERAQALDPQNTLAWENHGETERELGRDEPALSDFRKTLEIAESGRSDLNPAKLQVATLFIHANINQKLGAFLDDVALLTRIEQLPSYALSAKGSSLVKIADYGWLHDRASLDRQIAYGRAVAGDAPAYRDFLLTYSLQGRAMAGDWPGTIAVYREIAQTAAQPAFTATRRILLPGQGAAYYALALAGTGQFAQAETVIGATPRDCDICLRVRGRIAAMQKRWGRADFWFASEVKNAPSIPFGYSDWGMMKLAEGNADAAIAQFRIATDKGPRFADPVEGWGEALMIQNRSDLALAKFAAAARLAPNWGRLHLKWGEALFYAGHKDEARAQFAIASSLYLSDAEKSELARMRVAHG